MNFSILYVSFSDPIALTQTKNGKQSELVNEKKKNQTWTESGRNPKLSVSMSKEPDLEDFITLSLLVVSVFLPTATGRRWLLRQRVSCTVAVPNSWNLVLQNPQLWILYTLSLETYALIPVVIKNIYISDLGGMHTNNNNTKPRTQDFTWFSKSLHPRSAPALNSHYAINEYNSEELYSFKFTNSY